MRTLLFVVIAALMAGCGDSAAPARDLGSVDALTTRDGNTADAGTDVGGDAAAIDDSGLDLAIVRDASMDAARGDCVAGESAACYAGLAETLDVGACRAGTRSCASDGRWGECLGAVVPLAEVCGNGLDEDCNGSADDTVDVDGDGFTRCSGDCCDDVAGCPMPALVNVAAMELATPVGAAPIDDDCDGAIDELDLACDAGLAIDGAAPDAARALGLCASVTSAAPSGLVRATYTRANGAAAALLSQSGILPSFGANLVPQDGSALFALSSGRARASADPGACGGPSCTGLGVGVTPVGWPWSDSCRTGVTTTIVDDAALELVLRVPSNAGGFEVDYAFLAHDYPGTLCSAFNDTFAITVAPPTPDLPANTNVAFDASGEPITPNSAFMDACSTCALGASSLVGTGFETSGGTHWLRTTVPVVAGTTIVVRFVIADSGDANQDSTVVLDRFRWRPVTLPTTLLTERVAAPL